MTAASQRLSKVQKKGQVTIPMDVRKKLGLKQGDLVAFVETDEGFLIAPQEVVAMKALEQIGEALQEKGISLEELLADSREIRGKLMAEKYGVTEEQWAD